MWATPSLEQVEDDRQRHSTWWMRRLVAVDPIPARAILHVVCLGYYELYVNGQRVGEEPLAPALTRLDRRALRIDHDITSYLRVGENCLAIWCSCGWYLPHQFAVHAEWSPLLEVDASGMALSDRPWLCRVSNRAIIGPWKWNLFGGEEVDAREGLPGWNEVGCDTNGWHVTP